MTLSTFAFTPSQGYRDSSYAPTDPSSETEFRDTMQGIPDQLKEYINTVLLPSLASTTATSSGAREIGSETIAPLTGNTVYAQLVSLLNYINQTALNFTMGAIPDDSIETKKLKNVDMTPVQLSFGTNTIAKIGLETTPLNTTFTPLSYVNAQGKNGNCESVTPFTAVSGCTLSLDTSKKVFGANALKITLTDVVGIVSIPVGTTFDVSSNYLFSAYLDRGTTTDITLQKDATGGGVLRSVTSTSVTPTRSGFVTDPADNNAGNLIKIVVTGSIGQIAYIDGIMDNVITLTDYSALIATTLAKYPYVDSIGTTINPSVKITHAYGSIAQAVVEGEFLTGDLVNIVDNQVTGSKLWKKRVLFGKDYDWQYNGDYVGYKLVQAPIGIGSLADSEISSKYDGKIIKHIFPTSTADQSYLTGGVYYVSVVDTDTGWAEAIQPNDDEVKAFMNGWKASLYNGSRYIGWHNPLTLEFPYVTSPAVGMNAAGQNKLNVVDGTKYSNGRFILVKDVIGINFYTITEIVSNQLTLSPNLVNAVNDASQVIMCDDGTTDLRMMNYCKANVAPNYEGYKLYYKLATPQPINEGSDSYLAPLVGDVLMLETGANSVVFDTGVVKWENAKAKTNSVNYSINATNIASLSYSPLLHKVQSINTIYKNGVIDTSNWILTTNPDGSPQYYTPNANYDPSATYTVDYTILRTIAPQISTAQLKYADGLVSAIEGLYGIVDTKQNQSEVLDTLVDLAMYEKTDTISLEGRFTQFSSSDYRIKTNVKLINKLTLPIITISIISVARFNGDGTITNLSVGDVTTALSVYKGNLVVRFSYVGEDITTKTNLMSYGGFVNFTVTADCRGVI